MNNEMLVLGFESSCDETGVALVQWRGSDLPVLLGQALHSQIEMHQAYGGVVPELASRDHIRRILPLTVQALAASGRELAEVDVVAFTQGPLHSANRCWECITWRATCCRPFSVSTRRIFLLLPCWCPVATPN